MTTKDYFKALKEGREIVCVSNNETYDSAIFWMGKDNIIYTFSRHLGIINHSNTPINRILEHFKEMESEGQVFVRGPKES